MIKKTIEIVVSGDMVSDKSETMYGAIRLYHRDDANGIKAREGNHTDSGYSGYFLASIYDGKKWRKLQINLLIPYNQRHYQFVREREKVKDGLKGEIREWKGEKALYDESKKSFRIYSKEF